VHVGGDAHLARHRLQHVCSHGASTRRSPSYSPSRPRSTRGGPRSTPSSRPGSPTPEPRATTDSSRPSKEPVAASAIQTIRLAGYDSTAPAPSGPQPRLHADCAAKVEEPSQHSLPRPKDSPSASAWRGCRDPAKTGRSSGAP
jgi:hypothetical protein